MDMSNTRRIVILGKTGAGKSSLANTILSFNGRNITLIDTSGFFDTDRSEEEMKPEIVRCIVECAPGPHAFLIVLKVDRVTEQEQAGITEIMKYFSEECFKYATVVFTHGDQLSKGQKIEDFVRNNKIMSDLIKKCGGRCHVVDNKYWKNNQQDEYRNNQFQVEELHKTIDTIIEGNEGSCYTNEMLQAVEKEIQQEEELIRQSSGNMSQEEVSKQANGRELNRPLIKLAGAASGALLGAFYGKIMQNKAFEKSVQAIVKIATEVKEKGAAGIEAVVKTVAEAAGKSLIGDCIISPATGALVGGVIGYFAAEEADTPTEAVKRAAKDVKDVYKFISD